jgi:hypothetical protein
MELRTDHARIQAFLAILLRDVSSLSDDERTNAVWQLLCPNDARAFDSIHHVHGRVHQNARDFGSATLARFGLQQLQGFATVASHLDFVAELAKEHHLKNTGKKEEREGHQNSPKVELAVPEEAQSTMQRAQQPNVITDHHLLVD